MGGADRHARPPRIPEGTETGAAPMRGPTRGSVAPASFQGGSSSGAGGGAPGAEYGASPRPAREGQRESGGDPETK